MAVNSRKSRKKPKAVKKVKKLFKQITNPQWLRENRKQLLAIIAAFLIFVWVAGPAVFRLVASAPKEARGAGELFGKLVPRGDFSSAYRRWYALMSLMSQQPPSPDQMHQLTWEYLAYIHEAKQLGLFVSDEEVANQIIEMFGGKGKCVHFYQTGDELFEVMCDLEKELKVKSFFVMDENFLIHRKRALRSQKEKTRRASCRVSVQDCQGWPPRLPMKPMDFW